MNSGVNQKKMHQAYMRCKAGMTAMACILAVAVCLNAHAQTTEWKWVVGAGGERMDEATGIALDHDDNIYITGFFRETGVFGDTTLTFEGTTAHLFVSKLDNDGNWLWTRGAQSSNVNGSVVGVDNEGNVYVAGHFFRDIIINDTTHTGPRDLGFNLFVAKLDSEGNWEWSRSVPRSVTTTIYDLALDQSGSIYVTGMASGEQIFGDNVINAGHQNPFVAKMDSDGNWLWVRFAYCEGVALGRAIVVDSQGNSYITGHFVREISLGEINLNPGEPQFRTFLAKLDHEGNWVWAAYGEGSAVSEGWGIELDGDEHVYVTGTFAGDLVFDSHELHTAHGMNHNIFIAKADSSGKWLWAQKAGGEGNRNFGLDVFVSDAGNVFFTGFFQHNNSPFGHYELDGIGGRETIFIAKLDQHGNWLWADRAGGSLENNHGNSVVVDQDENIYLTGRAGRNASFGDHTLPGFGNTSIFLAKMRMADRETSAETLLELPSGYKLHQNYPNPFNPVTNIGYFLPESGPVSLVLYNTLGQQVARLVDGSAEAGYHEVQFDAADLPSGMYIYRLEAGDFRANRKLLIIK
ncbi:MAG: T9SS C-terminal target domain-containing protein [Balneolaceae bacterium]|nr:MAG: T9SS C-terminal target domain-containing protein [Balneolaceae bacterium]